MPKKISTKFQKRFINDIYEHVEKGGSINTFSAFLDLKYKTDISRKTINKWIETYPEFALAVESAEAKYLAYLEVLREMALLGKAPKGSTGINLKTVDFILQTRFQKNQEENKRPQIVIVRAPGASKAI